MEQATTTLVIPVGESPSESSIVVVNDDQSGTTSLTSSMEIVDTPSCISETSQAPAQAIEDPQEENASVESSSDPSVESTGSDEPTDLTTVDTQSQEQKQTTDIQNETQ